MPWTQAVTLGVAILLCAAPAEARPVVAVLAQNSGTEITDFLVPYAVISSSGAADVIAVSTEPGPVELFPNLEIRAQTTIDEFDHTYRDGADFVIIPAFHDQDNDVTLRWLRAQAASGATLVSICDGALTLARTGLLDGRRATGHFYSADARRDQFPGVNWQTDTRFVHDGPVVSSSGVSASLPAALYIVEVLSGRLQALEVARMYGVSDYSAVHDSDAFHVGAAEYWIGARNLLLAWPRDIYAVELDPGVDEIALGFAVDMLSRTYRSNVIAVAANDETVTRHGLRVLRSAAPDAVPSRAIPVRIGRPVDGDGLTVKAGAQAPRDVLDYLMRTYGAQLSAFVAMQLEYPTGSPANRLTGSPSERLTGTPKSLRAATR